MTDPHEEAKVGRRLLSSFNASEEQIYTRFINGLEAIPAPDCWELLRAIGNMLAQSNPSALRSLSDRDMELVQGLALAGYTRVISDLTQRQIDRLEASKGPHP